MFLRDHDRYNNYARYDHQSGKFEILERNPLTPETPGHAEFSGSFAIIDSTFVALYAKHGELFLRVGGRCLKFSENVQVALEASGRSRIMTILSNGEKVAELGYEVEWSANIEGDLTPFIDDEDFDFGLFLFRISSSRERKRRMIWGPPD